MENLYLIPMVCSSFTRNSVLHVHNNGIGGCGVYPYEVAETKVAQVIDHARKNQHPLQCIMEKK